MMRRTALPLLVLLAASGCSGRDTTSPVTQDRSPMAGASSASLTATSAQVTGAGRDGPSSQRSGALHITKECSQYTRLAGGFCTITSSNLAEIPVGTRVVYTLASGPTSLNTDITLVPPHGNENTAFGHVELNLAAGRGHATFSGGTGRLKFFKASVVISLLARPNWAWDGTYTLANSGDQD